MRPSSTNLPAIALALLATALGAPSPPPLSIAEVHKRQSPGAGSLYDYALANAHDGGGFIPLRVKVAADAGSGSGNANVADIGGNLTAQETAAASPSALPASESTSASPPPPPPEQVTLPVAGTNEDAPGVGTPPVQGFGLTSTDYYQAMISQGSQPGLPVPDADPAKKCEYTFSNVLGGGGTTALGELWALEDYVNLVPADVQQGGIGDCGMGAGIMALVTSGYLKHLKRSVVKMFDRPNAGDKTIAFSFRSGGKTDIVIVDDSLPKLSNANTRCWDYLGYQPVKDAAKPAADGSYPPTPIFFMPLFEKAFAKWLDYRDELRSSTAKGAKGTGYSGLVGVRAENVMAAVVGGTPKDVYRQNPGYDAGLLFAAFRCLQSDTPCVIGTVPIDSIGYLGSKDATGTIILPKAGAPVVYVGDQTPQNHKTYTVIDFDQVTNGRSTLVQLVGNHAYAIDKTRSTDPAKGWAAGHVTLINPWQVNPDYWKDNTGSGVWGTKPEVVLSFRAFSLVINSVHWVEDIPAF
ncbi:uncharacterized protein LOC62_02G002035 [Vanrija pseudolonga]|uniref:Calpain catalytic domain-containing protein n=1 Tax=Vanrija pseudolonga TaxID=143232 RepID=A0AAF0Y7X4_9TREE|nr:hypothetical protein LOC62_02G002035 [Vanrija pseudolonga]